MFDNHSSNAGCLETGPERELLEFSKKRTVVAGMVLILDGNSEICAHVRSNLCYLIFSRHLIR